MGGHFCGRKTGTLWCWCWWQHLAPGAPVWGQHVEVVCGVGGQLAARMGTAGCAPQLPRGLRPVIWVCAAQSLSEPGSVPSGNAGSPVW